jgi:hypothetical protein
MGVFLDMCDPSYFTNDLNRDKDYVDKFTQGIQNLAEYAHNKGLLAFINGVMGYAGYGDYYLWEDYVDTYSENEHKYTLLNNFLTSQTYKVT